MFKMKPRQMAVLVIAFAGLLLVVQVGLAEAVLDMDFKEAPLGDVFQVLGELAGYNVLIDPSVTGTISFYLKELTVTEALDLLIQVSGYDYRIVNNTLVVASKARLDERFQSQDSAFVALKNVSAQDASRLLAIVVPGVKTYIDPELNILFLFGTVGELDYATGILEKYDSIRSGSVQLEQASDPNLINQRIYIEHGNGLEILGILQRAFPSRQFAWDAGLRILSGVASEAEWQEIHIIVGAKDHPAFILKGLVRSSDRTLILIEYEGRTQLMQPGDSSMGWTLQRVVDKQVVFVKDDRSFTLEMGRQ
ncbi:MAG: hypothetical protein GX228_05045 [Firmicutes bacterium]|jgi:hypothetical protein|nr:secretin and TonB N-terminal domain-containing protein [Bacillota bacterium]NLL88288.1 hypothetical protein [Bacillota bacterium]HKM17417.1 secretin and TonB N-terminal domain-containing protein [Limnochordia bacterium]